VATQEQVAAEALREAQQLMNDKGAHWIQGQFFAKVDDGSMGYCSVGALNKALGKKSGAERDLALVTLAEVINPDFREEYAEEYPDDGEGYIVGHAEEVVINWNDFDDRDWTDVKDAFSRARRRLQDRARRKAKK